MAITRRAAAVCLAMPALAAVALLAGFAWFVQAARTAYPPPPPHADGIVALTGGAERVETALHLLADERARVLLVSGVGGPTEFTDLAKRAGIAPRLAPGLGARVTLGRAAASTHGNARETAEWAHANGLRSLLLVTAGYHMPRAMAEFARAMPGIALYPVPVRPGGQATPGLHLLAGEYLKYLGALWGLSSLGLGPSHGTEMATGLNHSAQPG